MDNNIIIYFLPSLVSIIAIGAPVIKLNSTITKLDVTLNNVINRAEEDRKITSKNCEKLEEHEGRLLKIEYKKGDN